MDGRIQNCHILGLNVKDWIACVFFFDLSQRKASFVWIKFEFDPWIKLVFFFFSILADHMFAVYRDRSLYKIDPPKNFNPAVKTTQTNMV